MGALIGVILLVGLIAAVWWLGSRSGASGGNGDNATSARRYGAGR